MYTIRMRQRYDNVAKFVTTEYAEPFKELLRAVRTPYVNKNIRAIGSCTLRENFAETCIEW